MCVKKESDFIKEEEVKEYMQSLVCIHETMFNALIEMGFPKNADNELRYAHAYREIVELMEKDYFLKC